MGSKLDKLTRTSSVAIMKKQSWLSWSFSSRDIKDKAIPSCNNKTYVCEDVHGITNLASCRLFIFLAGRYDGTSSAVSFYIPTSWRNMCSCCFLLTTYCDVHSAVQVVSSIESGTCFSQLKAPSGQPNRDVQDGVQIYGQINSAIKMQCWAY